MPGRTIEIKLSWKATDPDVSGISMEAVVVPVLVREDTLYDGRYVDGHDVMKDMHEKIIQSCPHLKEDIYRVKLQSAEDEIISMENIALYLRRHLSSEVSVIELNYLDHTIRLPKCKLSGGADVRVGRIVPAAEPGDVALFHRRLEIATDRQRARKENTGGVEEAGPSAPVKLSLFDLTGSVSAAPDNALPPVHSV